MSYLFLVIQHLQKIRINCHWRVPFKFFSILALQMEIYMKISYTLHITTTLCILENRIIYFIRNLERFLSVAVSFIFILIVFLPNLLIYLYNILFEVFTAVLIKSSIFWNIAPYSLLNANWCQQSASCWFLAWMDVGGDMFVQNVSWLAMD
jgi:hypothetical protein